MSGRTDHALLHALRTDSTTTGALTSPAQRRTA